MTIIRTVVHHRRIEIPAPDDMADGTEVVVELSPATEEIGIDESDWDDSPEGIEAWIKAVNALEPFILTDPRHRISRFQQQLFRLRFWLRTESGRCVG